MSPTRWEPGVVDPVPQKEFAALKRTLGEGRAKYFRSTTCAQGWLCTWGNSDGVTLWEDEDGVETVPVWSNPEYIEVDAQDRVDKNRPQYYKLSHFLYVTCPVLAEDGTRIGIFPVGNRFADILSVNDFVRWMEGGFE